MASNAVNLRFQVDSAQAQRELSRMQGSIHKVERSSEYSSVRMRRSFGGITTSVGRASHGMSLLRGAAFAAAGIGGLYGLEQGIRSTFDATREYQVANTRLVTQLKASNISWKANRKTIEQTSAVISRMSGFTDAELQDALSGIVRVTGDVTKGLDDLALATDIARAKNIDLATAGTLVAKVAGGNIGILSRYGIVIKKGSTATEALGILSQKFAGQARAYGETSAGAMDKFHAAVDNLEVTIGEHLIPTLTGAFNGVSGFIDEISRARDLKMAVSIVWQHVEDAASALWTGIENAFQGDAPTMSAALHVRWLQVGDVVSALWGDITDAFQGDAPTMAAAVKIRWTELSAAAGDLISGISDALYGSTTTGQRYSLSLHRVITFEKRDDGLFSDAVDAIKGSFEAAPDPAPQQKYSMELHRVITVPTRPDPSLMEALQHSVYGTIDAAFRNPETHRRESSGGILHDIGITAGHFRDELRGPSGAIRDWAGEVGHTINTFANDQTRRVNGWFENQLGRSFSIGFTSLFHNTTHGLDTITSVFHAKLPRILHTVQGWGSDVVHSVVHEFGLIPGALGNVWDSVSHKIDSAWNSITNKISSWVSTALSPINTVLGALGLDKINTHPAIHAHGGSGGGNHPGVTHRATGGPIDKPSVYMIGEEAPKHREWMIATNPAYRDKNVRYWMQAGHDLGIKGFASGGVLAGLTPGMTALAQALIRQGAQITSGYRSPAHNEAVGGAVGSYHTKGEAVDMVPNQRIGNLLVPLVSKLAELFGPTSIFHGHGWKFGRDIGQIPDHEDHIHVAYTGGVGSGRGLLGMLTGAVGNALGILGDPVGWLRGKLPKVPSIGGDAGRLAGGAMHYMADKVIGYVESKAASLAAAPNFGGATYGGRYSTGGSPRIIGSTHAPGEPSLRSSVANWIMTGSRLAGVNPTRDVTLALAARAWQESSWNPRAINLTDSNARRGTPSKGLMQTIDPTFRSYMVAGHGNIWNPIDNVAAAVRYMLHKSTPGIYGYTGVGYANGTKSARQGWAMVGERGPELVKFRGGERVVSNRESRAALRPITVNFVFNGVDPRDQRAIRATVRRQLPFFRDAMARAGA